MRDPFGNLYWVQTRIGDVSEEVLRETGRRPDDDRAVHAALAGAEDSAQPGSAELEGPAEALAELVHVAATDERRELCAGRLVGVVGHPCAGSAQ